MASLAVVWRNPNRVQRRLRWTQVRRNANRSLYLVLESVSARNSTWQGLPTLEVIRGGNVAAPRAELSHTQLPPSA